MRLLAVLLLLAQILFLVVLTKVIVRLFSGTLNVERLEIFGNKKTIVKALKVMLPLILVGVVANAIGFVQLLWKMF